MKRYLVMLLLVLAGNATGQIPKGWRLPTAGEIKGNWSEKNWDKLCQDTRDRLKRAANDAVGYTGEPKSDKAKDLTATPGEGDECWKPEKFPVHTALGDYNGDGLVDEARILMSTARPLKIGFFAFLKTLSPRPQVILLQSFKIESEFSPAQDHFIGTQPPVERMETWCSKLEECKPYEPKFLTIKRDSIIFGEFEAWAVVAYWSAAENKFKFETISD